MLALPPLWLPTRPHLPPHPPPAALHLETQSVKLQELKKYI